MLRRSDPQNECSDSALQDASFINVDNRNLTSNALQAAKAAAVAAAAVAAVVNIRSGEDTMKASTPSISGVDVNSGENVEDSTSPAIPDLELENATSAVSPPSAATTSQQKEQTISDTVTEVPEDRDAAAAHEEHESSKTGTNLGSTEGSAGTIALPATTKSGDDINENLSGDASNNPNGVATMDHEETHNASLNENEAATSNAPVSNDSNASKVISSGEVDRPVGGDTETGENIVIDVDTDVNATANPDSGGTGGTATSCAVGEADNSEVIVIDETSSDDQAGKEAAEHVDAVITVDVDTHMVDVDPDPDPDPEPVVPSSDALGDAGGGDEEKTNENRAMDL